MWSAQVTGSPISSRSAIRLSTRADRSTLRLVSPPAPRAADSTCSVRACNSSRLRMQPVAQLVIFDEFQVDAHGGDAACAGHGPPPTDRWRWLSRVRVTFSVMRLKAMAALRTSSGPFSSTWRGVAAARHHRGGAGQFRQRPHHPARHQGGGAGRHQDGGHGGDHDFDRPVRRGRRTLTAEGWCAVQRHDDLDRIAASGSRSLTGAARCRDDVGGLVQLHRDRRSAGPRSGSIGGQALGQRGSSSSSSAGSWRARGISVNCQMRELSVFITTGARCGRNGAQGGGNGGGAVQHALIQRGLVLRLVAFLEPEGDARDWTPPPPRRSRRSAAPPGYGARI